MRLIRAILRILHLRGIGGALRRNRRVIIHVIQGVEETTFEGIPADGLKLDVDCTIFTIGNVEREMVNEVFAPFIGLIATQSTLRAAALANVIKESTEPIESDNATRFLLRVKALVHQFLMALWLVKDNSANAVEGYAILFDPRGRVITAISQR